MRTKIAILAAAFVAAGAATSMAQSNVYSLNVVGYINANVSAGYTLLANQLNPDATGNIATVLGTNFVTGFQVLKWNPATQNFSQPDTFFGTDVAPVAGWYDTGFGLSATTLKPGEAFFLFNPAVGTNVTLVGEVVQGTNNVTLGAGYSFVSVVPPLVTDVGTNANLLLPGVLGMQFLTFGSGQYSQPLTYFDTSVAPVAGWYDTSFNLVPVAPTVGQGFVIFNPGSSLTWSNKFTVQ